jgi:group I intron endonuclease
MAWLIYKHTCSASQKSYIGVTSNLSKRTVAHKLKSSRCPAFYGAIKKYGWNLFSTEVLAADLSLDAANKLEPELIKEHNTLVPHGYNIKEGGDIHRMSERTRAKMEPYWATLRGSKRSQEICEKISHAKRGRPAPLHVIEAMLKGQHPPSIETRSKMSLAKKNRTLPTTHVENICRARTGTMWITDGTRTRSVAAHETIPEGWRRGRTFNPQQKYEDKRFE